MASLGLFCPNTSGCLLLNLYNTLTRRTEPFKPIGNKEVKMYSCGPSTYQQSHIGNYRTFLFQDVLQRYLEYLGYNVVRLVTLTNVEDKAIAEAKKESLSVAELTKNNENIFSKDSELLRIRTPDYSVRASEIVDQAVRIIKVLVRKGIVYCYKYKGERNFYFNPLKTKDFGKLARLDMKNWPKKKKRFHKDTYPGTRWNRGDFVLWHGCQEKECPDTKIGKGRPSWNIQDIAMVTKHLGNEIDIACGGVDNLARHHDYNLAIAESFSDKQFANYWLHGEHLLVDGKKMSKSKGNVYYPNDIIEKGYQNFHLRFFLIYGYYHRKLIFTLDELASNSKRLDAFRTMVQDLKKPVASTPNKKPQIVAEKITSNFERHMNNDLDVKSSFDELFKSVSELHRLKTRGRLSSKDAQNAISALTKIDAVLQVIF